MVNEKTHRSTSSPYRVESLSDLFRVCDVNSRRQYLFM